MRVVLVERHAHAARVAVSLFIEDKLPPPVAVRDDGDPWAGRSHDIVAHPTPGTSVSSMSVTGVHSQRCATSACGAAMPFARRAGGRPAHPPVRGPLP